MEEDVGMIAIPVVRLHGTFGRVTADFIAQSSSALPGGIDYLLHGSSVTFQHGQNLSFINVSIVDDDDRLVLIREVLCVDYQSVDVCSDPSVGFPS